MTHAHQIPDLRPILGVPPRRNAWRRAALGCAMLFTLCFEGQAATYSCGDPFIDHCYGTNSWRRGGGGEYFGAYADIVQDRLSCPRGCGGFVNDELWLVDEVSSGCRANQFERCWVEAGTIAFDGSNPVYFWADSRPINAGDVVGSGHNTSTFNLHLLSASDPAGVTDHFMIIKDGRVSPQTFLVFIYNDSLSTLYNGVSAVPSGTPMRGNLIIIGQELAGTRDASADRVNFTRNIWAVQTLGSEFVFWYNRQTATGGVQSDNPPFAEWTINPASPPPPEGGQFTTRCCG